MNLARGNLGGNASHHLRRLRRTRPASFPDVGKSPETATRSSSKRHVRVLAVHFKPGKSATNALAFLKMSLFSDAMEN